MRINRLLLLGVLLLSSSLFAAAGDRNDRNGSVRDRKHHSMPEPGSMVMLTLTAGTLVGGMLVRRRIHGSTVR
jgi:hypothetical protein